MIDYTKSPGVAVQKPAFKRSNKPTQKQMGSISQKVRKQVRERSQGICEIRVKCHGSPAVEQAHLTTRGTIKHRTTAEDLLHSCVTCHIWMDRTVDGIRFKKKRVEELSSRAM
jgi:heterodisulfide reductase subunit B